MGRVILQISLVLSVGILLNSSVMMQIAKTETVLNGRKAIENLKQTGEFDSLKNAVNKTIQANQNFTGSTPILNETWETTSRDDARETNDSFGNSIAMDGNTVVVGMQGDEEDSDEDPSFDSGAVYVFAKSGSVWIQQAKLTASDRGYRGYFGASVGISGSSIVVGAPNPGTASSTEPGAAYVFRRSLSTWTEEAKLTATDGAALDLFGRSVAIFGNTVVVGSLFDDDDGINSGSAYVYTRSRSIWSQRTKLTSADADEGDNFGRSVAIETGTIIIGADADTVGNSTDAGSVYVFTGSGATWSERAKINASDRRSNQRFGFSVDISGDTIAIGAFQANAVYVFTDGGSNWSEQAKLTALDGNGDDFFGYKVSIDNDSIAVGAPFKNENGGNSGSTYIFTRNGSNWTPQQVTVSDNAAEDRFGSSVAVDGNTIFIGARGNDNSKGSAYLFTKPSNSWVEQANLIPFEGAFDEFGYSVAIAGNTAVVGAFRDDDNGTNSGSAYVFIKSGSLWIQQAKLTASDGADGDFFGRSVAISGDTIIVGAYPENNTGSAYIFTRFRSTWTEETKLTASDRGANDNFGFSVGITERIAIVGSPLDNDNGSDSGSAYIFTKVNSTWSQEKLLASDGNAGDNFGWQVAIDGNSAVIGAYKSSDSGSNSGAAYVFAKSGSTWSEQQKLTASDAELGDNFGFSVAISGGTVVIGARGDDDNGFASGSAYIFSKNAVKWVQQAKLMASNGAPIEYFGNSVGIFGDTVLVGSYWNNENGQKSGSAYVFKKNGSIWVEYRKLLASNGADNDFFGNSVAISGSNAISGASGKDVFPVSSYSSDGSSSNLLEANQGSTYFFDIPDQPVAPAGSTKFDFDGDSKTDVSIFRPAPGEWWYSRSSDGGNFAVQFGSSTDKLVPADFTGDGKTDIAFWRPSTGEWFILRSENSTFYGFPFGASGDIPAPGDFDGDGIADAAVFRPSNSTWYIQRSSDGGTTIQGFGISEDKPVVADYDGDGKDDIAIFRPSVSEWWINRSTDGTIAYQFGTTGDKTVQGDYTGDGKADVAIWRPSNGNWLILRSENTSFYGFPFGSNGDIASPGDYDGDGVFDAAVFRPTNTTWYINGSTSGTQIVGFGINGDVPLPSSYSVP